MKYTYKKQYYVKALFTEFYVVEADSKNEADSLITSSDINQYYEDSDIDVDFDNKFSSEIIYDDSNNIVYAKDKKKV